MDLVRVKRSKKIKFWINFRLPGGQQRREFVSYSIEKARDADGKRRSQKRENKIFDMTPEADFTLNQLTEWYLPLEKDRIAAGDICEMYFKVKETNLKNFNSVFGDMIVNQICRLS